MSELRALRMTTSRLSERMDDLQSTTERPKMSNNSAQGSQVFSVTSVKTEEESSRSNKKDEKSDDEDETNLPTLSEYDNKQIRILLQNLELKGKFEPKTEREFDDVTELWEDRCQEGGIKMNKFFVFRNGGPSSETAGRDSSS
eukprot:GHVS01066147.1.p1 GENE.GHVS01066147.1~~GHVS01066147.1.p1  ORF type:complete len:168 (-),score=18.34 GHVS01066147.1:90-518(-)